MPASTASAVSGARRPVIGRGAREACAGGRPLCDVASSVMSNVPSAPLRCLSGRQALVAVTVGLNASAPLGAELIATPAGQTPPRRPPPAPGQGPLTRTGLLPAALPLGRGGAEQARLDACGAAYGEAPVGQQGCVQGQRPHAKSWNTIGATPARVGAGAAAQRLHCSSLRLAHQCNTRSPSDGSTVCRDRPQEYVIHKSMQAKLN